MSGKIGPSDRMDQNLVAQYWSSLFLNSFIVCADTTCLLSWKFVPWIHSSVCEKCVSVMVSCSSFLQFQVMPSGSCTCLKIKEVSRVNVKFVGQDLVGFDQVSSPRPVPHTQEV